MLVELEDELDEYNKTREAYMRERDDENVSFEATHMR